MSLNRRQFLNLAAGTVATSLLSTNQPLQAGTRPAIKAIGFDAFTTFDPRPISALADSLFPDKGIELSNLWRTRLFEYTWLRTLYGNYADFWQVAKDALEFAASMLKLELTVEKRDDLMGAFLKLKAYPDVPSALQSLQDAGIRMAFVSDLTGQILESAVKNSGVQGFFEFNLSTDAVHVFKPDRRAYQMAIDAFNLPREEIAFAAAGGWDVGGAKSFGYTTFWVNRLNHPVEQVGVTPDGIGGTLTALADFVLHKI
jgi:2-haloacid dehalogenase